MIRAWYAIFCMMISFPVIIYIAYEYKKEEQIHSSKEIINRKKIDLKKNKIHD